MEKGEFAYNKSYSSEYPVGAVKRLKLYDLGVLSTLYILFSIEDESLAEWIEAFFESDKWHKEIIKRASEGARNHGLLNISPTDFFELPFCYPSTPEEQQEIAQFFSRLDTLIAAEDKKLVRLKNMKAASLEKMFPKQGETVPQIRFKGFSGEWKEHKLKEITERITRKNNKLESNLALTISAQHGLIAQEDFFNRRIASSQLQGYYLIKKGEFAYNKSYSSEYPVGAVKCLTEYDMGVLSTLYIVFSLDSEIDPYWFTSYFETSIWHSEVLKRAAEGARNHGLLNISPEDFFDIPIIIPKNNKEQMCISHFFSRFDKLISAQEQKLVKLRSMKKSFLEKMFVSQ
jgi:type I restriction enzyme S subunit